MLAMTLACASRGTAPIQPQSPIEPGPVIATIDGEAIHLSAVDQWLKDDWMSGIAEDPTQLYQLRRAGIDGVIDELLVARAAAQENLSSDAYLNKSTAALGPVSDTEVRDFYERNKDRLRPSESIDKLRYKIRAFLEGDRSARVINELREAAEIDILMDIVKSVGLPVDQAREVVDERTYKSAIDADWEKSHQYGVTGVPTFVSQGFGLVGAQPYENLAQFVQGVIDKANELKNEK